MKFVGLSVPVIIGALLIYFAYDYLRKLEECMCAQGKVLSEEHKANIHYLKQIELLLLILLFVNLLFAFQSRLTPLLSTLFFFAILVVYAVFVKNVYQLYQNLPSDCDCALKWPRFYIYLQAILMTLVLLTFVMAILLMVYSSQRMVLKGRK
jgi:hypothetical protein